MIYDRLIFNVHPIFFDSLSKENQTDLVNYYTKVVKQTSQELDVGPLRNTLAHEIVHLHSDKLFRMIFSEGCPLLNKPNAEGSTPLLDAVAANDEPLVIELLKGDIAESINYPNHRGITPLLAAVNTENPRLVELLLRHGAVLSVNMLDARNISPLHIAVTFEDSTILQILLKHGAEKSIMIQDFNNLTPFQRAIISRRTVAVKILLEVKPELAETLNIPDSHGVTDFQRCARSGSVEMWNLLRAHSKENEIKANPAASFLEEDLKDCLIENSINFHKFPIDEVAFPLTIAQCFCNVMISLKNGKILKVPNSDVKDVRKVLLEMKYGKEELVNTESNILTFYLNSDHGFSRLECINCQQFWAKPRIAAESF